MHSKRVPAVLVFSYVLLFHPRALAPWPSDRDSRDGGGCRRSFGPASIGPPRPGTELDRIILYVPARILDLAEALAEKAGVASIQDYCGLLLMQAIENEQVRQKIAGFESRRGPLEGLKEIADDPDYLAEWQQKRSDEKADASARRGAPPDRRFSSSLRPPSRCIIRSQRPRCSSPGAFVRRLRAGRHSPGAEPDQPSQNSTQAARRCRCA